MVSEPRASYAAVVTGAGESSEGTPVAQPPGNGSPAIDPRRSQSNREDIDNPLYLNSNESSNAVLVSPPLSGSANYVTWSISMRVALEVKNKWGIVDGSILAPDRSHSQYAAWRRCNLMICSWICRSVHPSMVQSIVYMDDAKEVWNDLRKRFAQRDALRISILQGEIYALKQGSFTVNEYYTKCRALWEQMNELRPIPICKCLPRGSCDLLAEIKSEREVDRIIRFLQGLNDEFNSLKSNVLVLDPLPDIHRVFVMAEKSERQMNLVHMTGLEVSHANATQSDPVPSEETIAAVNYSNGRKYMNNNTHTRSKCTYCGMNGHMVEKCYKKHGYPPVGCPVSSQKPGNKWQQLPQATMNQAGQSLPSTTAAITLTPTFKEDSHNERNYSINTHINSVSLESSAWLLDSGATDHIACSINMFNDYHSVKGAVVNLPNGKHIPVQHIGNIRLNDDLWLRNVLHIPEFQFNILSVAKLLRDSSYTLVFTADQCSDTMMEQRSEKRKERYRI
ncbi:PREDICTED: uncharacterized protein LOC109146696 [Ipomoea nil]|uniref:uncharacterized protein LOC109146696 n=1 Tax=Ipomoea nil TaxID=35883 RepID=UPI000901AA46|nr:PREDICTED: uncharacterized protein LOC109146696 [Ipomoea nil]